MNKKKFLLLLCAGLWLAACAGPVAAPPATYTPPAADTAGPTPAPPATFTPPSLPTEMETLTPLPTETVNNLPALVPFEHLPLAATGPYLVYQKNSELVFMDEPGLGWKSIPFPAEAAWQTESLPLSQKVSPDGKWMAYLSGSAGSCMGVGSANTSDLSLKLLDLATGESRLVTRLLSADYPDNFARAATELNDPAITAEDLQNAFVCGFIQGLAWSPDGSKLAFAGQMEGDSSDLYLYDLATQSIRRLSSGPEEVQTIRWSADGKWIINQSSYRYGEGMKMDLFITNADDLSVQQVDRLPAELNPSTWLNDHQYMLNEYADNVGRYNLQAMDLHSNKPIDLWPGQFDSPAFIYGNSWVAFYARTAEWPPKADSSFTPGLYYFSLLTFKLTRLEIPVQPANDSFRILPLKSNGGMTFLVRPEGENQDIYVISPKTAKLTLAGFNSARDVFVSPDQRQWLAISSTQIQRISAEGVQIQSLDLPPQLQGKNVGPVVWWPGNGGFYFGYSGSGDDAAMAGIYAVDFAKNSVVMLDAFPMGSVALGEAVWVGVAK